MHGVLGLAQLQCKLGLASVLQAASPPKPPRRFVSGSTEFLEASSNPTVCCKIVGSQPLFLYSICRPQSCANRTPLLLWSDAQHQ